MRGEETLVTQARQAIFLQRAQAVAQRTQRGQAGGLLERLLANAFDLPGI